MMSSSSVPKAVRWQTLAGIVIVALIAITVGAAFAGPLRAGLSTAGRWLGFGHEHEHEIVAVTDESGEVQYYTCGMHPWVILPAPGDCPICHMDLTPIDPDKFTGEIAIDPVVVQNMGVRIAPVVTGPLTRTMRTVGTAHHAESAMIEINPRYRGWVEKLHVDYEGQHVHAGQPLAEVFSPQLYAAQEELLLARGNAELFEAARQRLLNLGMSEHDVEAAGEAERASRRMTIHSPITGHVVAKAVVEGMHIEPGRMLYRLADHSRVWVDIAVYEQQIPWVTEGMPAEITVEALPGRTFEAKVIYVAPHLDMTSRQLTVRVEVLTPEHELKPGMYATVLLRRTVEREATLAPRSAVIDTGERQVAFVSRGDGRFEPRDVHLGVRTGDGQVEIISGLKPGEMVVTSGQFLIDSESKMREALAKMITGDHAPQLATALDELVKTEVPANPHLWHEHQDAIATARSNAFKMVDTGDLAEARLQFAELSTSLETLLMATGVPPSFDREVQVLHCPMYREGQGGTIWPQPAGDVRNPYFGATMLGCFDERRALPVTGGSAEGKEPTADQPEPSETEPAQADDQPAARGSDEYPLDFCLVSGEPLGSMGAPITMEYEGRTVKFCCEACIGAFQADPDAYLKKLDEAAETLGKTQGGR